MSQPLDIIIVERLGTLKILSVKDFKIDELYKKCGFKKPNDFNKQVEWNVKCDGKKYFIKVYAKSEGRGNFENKYDFPPPIDNKLFYGSCAIIAETVSLKEADNFKKYTNLNLGLWNKIYEKLFGGFEDLTNTLKEDENEPDELLNVPKENKTKNGYLKDGFVVDSEDTDDSTKYSSEEDTYDESETDDVNDNIEDDITIDDIGSELTEEKYDYEEDENDNKL